MSDRPGPPTESPASGSPLAPAPHPEPVTSADPIPAEANVIPVAGSSSAAHEPMEISETPFALTEPAEEGEEGGKAPRSRTKTIVLGSLLVITLAGATAIGYAGWRIASQKDATLAAPARVGDFSLDTSEDGQATADYLLTALSAEVDLNEAVGGVYSDGSPNNVLFFGGTALIWTPSSDLETAFELFSDEQGAVTGLHDVDAGSLGGTVKCGTTKNDNADMPVCGWADHGSLAMAMFPGRTEPEAARLLVTFRDAAQTRD